MIGSLGWQELLIIFMIVALIFGAGRLAGLGRSLGQGIREFRSEVRKGSDEAADADANAVGSADSTNAAAGSGTMAATPPADQGEGQAKSG